MQYGISELSIIPIRSDASDKAEMVSQVLFGEHFKVLENRKKWSRIRLSHDNYEGWICNKQWLEIEEETYKILDKEISTITTDILDVITKDYPQPIVIGSILPSYKSGYALIGEIMYQFDGLITPGFSKKEKLDFLNFSHSCVLFTGVVRIRNDMPSLISASTESASIVILSKLVFPNIK